MAVIGGIEFARAVGPQIAAPYPRAKLIDRPGTDGRVMRLMPAKSEPVQWETVEWVIPAANATQAQERYDRLRSKFVMATDDLGRSMAFVTVLDVQVLRVQALAVASPAANYAVYARWTLIRPG